MAQFYGFGSGKDGQLTVTTNTTEAPVDSSCSGTSGASTLVATNASFQDDDMILIHQSRGTGGGSWELNFIDTYAAGNVSVAFPLSNTYTDSGASQAQVREVPEYSGVTVNSGVTYSAKASDGNVGGILFFLCTGTVTNNGTISAVGYSQSQAGGFQTIYNGGGFRGGKEGITSNRQAYQGEGTSGAGGQSTAANGSGGGAGQYHSGYNRSGGGGGGGNGGAGGNGGLNNTDIAPNYASGGTGGSAAGTSSLSTMVFGGGGGGGSGSSGNHGEPGSNGGGIIGIFAETIINNGTITVKGGKGEDCYGRQWEAPGGGGAGGSFIAKCVNWYNYGTIDLSGGQGGGAKGYQNGGGGGGGRGYVECCQSFATGTILTSGGAPGTPESGFPQGASAGSSGTWTISTGGHDYCQSFIHIYG